jgi:peptidoglycan hydrolase-like protein with peptidoglycan-binding domain
MLRSLAAVFVSAAALVLLVTVANAQPESRTALVIGNAAYTHQRALGNPVNDATAMADTLRRLGFDVVSSTDADRNRMVKALGEFRRKLRSDGVGLFYYAGHGMQVRGHNYLLPVDADISDENDAALLAIDLETVQHQMEDAGVRLSLYILDACRDNPFERRFRAVAPRGLAPVDAARGAVIVFATAPGKTAADGEGEHGLFTGALLKNIQKPGLELEDVLKQTAQEVESISGNRQVPWYNSAFSGHFQFLPSSNNKPSASAQNELIFWESIKSSGDPIDFEDFLKRYPQSEFASIAQRRLAYLRALPAQPAVAPPGDRSAPKAQEGDTSWSLEERREIQRALRLLGHYRGEADGGFGPGTRAAIRQFEAFEGLPEKGELSNEERTRLLDLAQRLAAILDQAPTSPDGVTAASLTGAQARYARGWAAENGQRVQRNMAEAAYWYALAAAEGNAHAFTNLGTLMARGQGVPNRDTGAAMALWHAAAARGEPIAMFNLGVLYEQAIGVEVDLVRARAWYERAAALKHPGARAALQRLSSTKPVQ